MEGKGTYKLLIKNDNFPDGKIDYDLNGLTGFDSQKALDYLTQQQHMVVVPETDMPYNACLFALASKQDMSAILSMNLRDYTPISSISKYFFGSGLGADSESSTQAEIIES